MTDRDTDAFAEVVIETIAALSSGEIATYGEIAEEAGYPGAARAVGTLLSRTSGLPWWRVIAANGRLVPGMEAEHAQRLRAEGIEVKNGAVVMQGRT
ncbi:MAG: MGMT family protein [Actinomycetia bacterium]|nr:MGMT family protein [Actinomycetes bacterium]